MQGRPEVSPPPCSRLAAAAVETKPLGRGLSSDFGNSRALNPHPYLESPQAPYSALEGFLHLHYKLAFCQ